MTHEQLMPGVIFDHAVRPPEELAVEVIKLALDLGWQDAGAAELVDTYYALDDDTYAWDHEVAPSYTLVEALQEAAYDAGDSAESYLNEHCAPAGYWIGNDGDIGAFGVWVHSVYVVELTETVTRDDDGETVEGDYGVMLDGEHVSMAEHHGRAALTLLDTAAELVPLDDLTYYGAFDSVEDDGDETIAYLADVPDVGDDVPYVRAILILHPDDVQRDAVRETLGSINYWR